MKVIFNPYLFNPVFWHIWAALQDPKIRKIMVRGGSAGGKTAGVCDAVNLYQMAKAVNVFALRKHRIHVDTTIKPSFEASIDRRPELAALYDKMDREIRVQNGASTVYAGMDDSEKIKGLESFDIVFANELNQFEVGEWDEIDRRLRGRPNQKIIADWNPIISTHWINEEILGPEEGWTDLPLDLPDYERDYGAFTRLTQGYAFKRINAAGNTIWLNVTYRDNFWIVGHPAGPEYGFRDEATLAVFERMKIRKPNDYRIYGLGEDGLARTGGELWTSFDEAKHTRDLDFEPGHALHITLDSNVVPYVTVSIWQLVRNRELGFDEIRQIWEIPARPPDNTAFKAALLLGKYLARIKYEDSLIIYGDPAGNARTTVDDNGRSFFDKFIQTVERLGFKVINRVQKSPPQVVLSIDFINDIYGEIIKGYRILISKGCRTSIEDYNLVRQGADGKLEKKKTTDPITLQKFERYGHFTDAKRYLITTMLNPIFNEYKKGSRTARIMSVTE